MKKERKDATVTIRLSAKDLKKIKERAAELGLTTTDFIINTTAR
jgi:predicted DNA binding CopG/RHH family protein